MSSRILALDVGVTTGWACIDGDELLDYSVIGFDHRHTFRALKDLKPDFTIAEEPIIFRGELGEKLKIVVNYVNYTFGGSKGFTWINQKWKDSKFRSFPCPRGLTAHERDAIRMARWYEERLLRG